MAYATIANAEELYGAARIAIICDRDHSGAVDTSAFERQLSVATQQMNGYLLGRYPLPRVIVPDVFKKYCVDIAIYNSALDPDVRSDEFRVRFDDAIKYMEKIADGTIKLQVTDDTTEISKNHAAETVVAARPIAIACVGGSAHEFTAVNTRRIL